MSDLSKCNDSFCPSKDHCYRFTAPASLVWQSFADFQRRGRPCCDSYWPVNEVKVERSYEPAR